MILENDLNSCSKATVSVFDLRVELFGCTYGTVGSGEKILVYIYSVYYSHAVMYLSLLYRL